MSELDLKSVDNYMCAGALDRFHKNVVKPLRTRIEKNEQHMEGLSDDNKKKVQPQIDALKIQMERIEDIEVHVMVLIKRHEHVVSQLAKHFVQIRDKVLWEEKIPTELMEEQAEILLEMYNFLATALKELEI